MMKINLIYIIDESNLQDSAQVIINLARGSIVIFRCYALQNKKPIAQYYQKLCKDKKLPFLIAKDLELFFDINPDGIHIPYPLISRHPYQKLMRSNKIISISAHSNSDLYSLQKINPDIILLSKAFSSKTHGDLNLHTRNHFRMMLSKHRNLTISALGGINYSNYKLLQNCHLNYISGIDGIKTIIQNFNRFA